MVPFAILTQTWLTFLTNHLAQTAAIDFFTVPTATFRVLFVFLVLSHDRRRVVHFGVTDSSGRGTTPPIPATCRLVALKKSGFETDLWLRAKANVSAIPAVFACHGHQPL